MAQVQATLARQAGAVVGRSPQRFLAEVDSAAADAPYRSAQSNAIAALSQLAVSTWSYAVVGPVVEAATVQAAAHRLGAPVSIVHLRLSYALQGIDPEPVTHDVWQTFVQRRGQVYVAGDADMTALGGTSWRGPWDFGPVQVVRGATAVVIGPPGDPGVLSAIAAGADTAVATVSAGWGRDWPGAVAVVVPNTAAEFTELGGPAGSASGPGGVPDVSAATVFEGTSARNGNPDGARVLVSPSVLGALTGQGRQIVLTHEVAHVATASVTAVGTPRWLVEGFAEYEANLGTGQPVRQAAAELQAEIAAGHVPAHLPTDAAFGSSGAALAAVYEQSWLAASLIAARAGVAGLARFYRLVGTDGQVGVNAGPVIDAALRTDLHLSTADFETAWRSTLIAELG